MYKRKKFGVILLVIAVLAVILLGGGYYIKTTYTVSTVYVEGNVHYTEDEIKDIVMSGFLRECRRSRV